MSDKANFKRSISARKSNKSEGKDSEVVGDRPRFRRNGNRTSPSIIPTETASKQDQVKHSKKNQVEKNKTDGTIKHKARTKKILYPDYSPLSVCLDRYGSGDSNLVRGKLRVMPGGSLAFVACDRGSVSNDVVLENDIDRNRAMDGDIVFVELKGTVNQDRSKQIVNGDSDEKINEYDETSDITQQMKNTILKSDIAAVEPDITSNLLDEDVEDCEDCVAISDINTTEHDDVEYIHEDYGLSSDEEYCAWQEDAIQMSLWNPVVQIKKNGKLSKENQENTTKCQFRGCVIHIIPMRLGTSKQASEINPSDESALKNAPRRTFVGTLKELPAKNFNRFLFVPNNKSLPRFITPPGTRYQGITNEDSSAQMFKAEYVYGTWKSDSKWPPCTNVKPIGKTLNVEDETSALLVDYGVDHGDFAPHVLKNVDNVVQSGRFNVKSTTASCLNQSELGWAPTPEMYHGRRDYREQRIFTIDPTTAKDLDDAVHIKVLPDGRVEVGVHIADVTYFVTPGTAVDEEASKRATTVYLVDRTIPMLPRPLCEIACSLNENVERLAFSCVWTMNMDGTMGTVLREKESRPNEVDVWYGRTVIKSCARLDYATAQHIIDGNVANGEKSSEINENFWPKSRQPTGGHTIDEVAADVRLMHRVAMARRHLRFANGALALHGGKLAFQLENDGETPCLCEPYPIRDSNRLIEEYMLLANFLVAQRLITHAGGLALLRHHPPPISNGLQNVVDIAQESVGFCLDGRSSQTLQESLSKMGRECEDHLAMQCVTEMLMTPMRPAEYIAAGVFDEVEWRHFALNIPYYTHFTSPIRRYADVIVHRLLQATLDGEKGLQKLSLKEADLQNICEHCNDMRMASKKAQERSDRIFLSLYLRAHPVESTLGVVLSVGDKAFTIFVPSLCLTTMVFLQDHADQFTFSKLTTNGKRHIQMKPSATDRTSFEVKVFTKLAVTCRMKQKPPIDVQVLVLGPWNNS